jgi:hypothetical protein
VSGKARNTVTAAVNRAQASVETTGATRDAPIVTEDDNGGMKVIMFLICFAIFLLGFYLMSIADVVTGGEAITFIGGILAVALSIAIPVHILPKFD